MKDLDDLRNRLHLKVSGGERLVFAGAGNGLSAKCAELGGADGILIYNSGRFRMAGRGSLSGLMPYGNANETVIDLVKEVVPVVEKIPVIAGVCGTDPFLNLDRFFREITTLGVLGIQNFPTVGLIDGDFRRALESTGISYQAEVRMIERASEYGFLTMPYVFDKKQARLMAEAGADFLVIHFGLTAGGLIGENSPISIKEATDRVAEIIQAVSSVDPCPALLCHGGPVSDPEDLRAVLAIRPELAGFVGASSIERIPTERGIIDRVTAFREITN